MISKRQNKQHWKMVSSAFLRVNEPSSTSGGMSGNKKYESPSD